MYLTHIMNKNVFRFYWSLKIQCMSYQITYEDRFWIAWITIRILLNNIVTSPICFSILNYRFITQLCQSMSFQLYFFLILVGFFFIWNAWVTLRFFFIIKLLLVYNCFICKAFEQNSTKEGWRYRVSNTFPKRIRTDGTLTKDKKDSWMITISRQ